MLAEHKRVVAKVNELGRTQMQIARKMNVLIDTVDAHARALDQIHRTHRFFNYAIRMSTILDLLAEELYE